MICNSVPHISPSPQTVSRTLYLLPLVLALSATLAMLSGCGDKAAAPARKRAASK